MESRLVGDRVALRGGRGTKGGPRSSQRRCWERQVQRSTQWASPREVDTESSPQDFLVCEGGSQGHWQRRACTQGHWRAACPPGSLPERIACLLLSLADLR